jgi:hypothetical protein
MPSPFSTFSEQEKVISRDDVAIFFIISRHERPLWRRCRNFLLSKKTQSPLRPKRFGFLLLQNKKRPFRARLSSFVAL